AFSGTLTTGALDPSRSRWFGACLRRPAPRGLPSSRTDIAWRTVIGIPHKTVSGLMELPVQTVEHDIREERGTEPALRRAHRRGFEDSVFHHPRSQKSFDQGQDVAVGRHRGHNHAMREVVEGPLKIRVEHHGVPLAVEFQHSLDRLMAVATGNE